MKPNNPRAIAQGWRQARGYAQALDKEYPGRFFRYRLGYIPLAMSERNVVQTTFDQFGRKTSMEKKGSSWYWIRNEVIAVSNLQKSHYGPRYCFNQGFWLRQFGEDRYPKPYQCHVVGRLERFLPKWEREIAELFDLENATVDNVRSTDILKLLKDGLLPILAHASTVTGMRQMREEGAFRRAGLKAPAIEVLSHA